MDTTNSLLEKYKKHPFAKGLLPFLSALRSLDTPYPRIYAQEDGRQRWVIYDKATKQPALFSYAAVFAESQPEDTGNYVPSGNQVPDGVEQKNVQIRPNGKCFYTYIFDTYGDTSLYDGLWILDEYIVKVPGFNPGGLSRREYLSGHDARYRSRFWMQTPIFFRRGPQETRVGAPEHLHPWIVQADRESKIFRANPDRPRVWMKDGDDTVPISRRVPDSLQRGDHVAVSFTVAYYLTSVNWFAQFHPADLILLKSSDGEATDYSAPALDLHSRPAPSFLVVAVDEVEMADEGVVVQAEPNVASSSAGDDMEDVDEEGDDESHTVSGGARTQQSMDIDKNVVRKSSPDTLGSSPEHMESIDGFEVLAEVGDDDNDSLEEFVDVEAKEHEGRAGRGSGGIRTRAALKRG